MISIHRILSIAVLPLKLQFPLILNRNSSHLTIVNGDSQLLTFAFCSNALKNSANRGLISHSKQLHSHLLKLGFHGALSVQNQIIHAYAKCGDFTSARQLFDEIPAKNIVSWNTVICGVPDSGFVYFRRMLLEMANPDYLTLNGLIRASSEMNQLASGNQLHCFVVKLGFASDSFVGCALIDLYRKFGLVHEARSVFDVIEFKDLVLWSAMVSCYAVNLMTEEALKVFQLMSKLGVNGDEFTFCSVLSSCAKPGYCELGKQLHGVAIKLSFDLDLLVANSLVDVYAKNEAIADARKAFDGIVGRNVVSWNTMIVGYGQNGGGIEATKLLVQILRKRLDPDELTLASVISSCGNLSFFNEVMEMHCFALKSGFEAHLSIANALISAYSKCGNLHCSLNCFLSVSEPNLITMTSMLRAYGLQGQAKESIEIFELILEKGFRPDEIAFLAVISSCSHGGFVSQGLHYFKMMVNDYQIVPRSEHYACLVDLLGRYGLIDEAVVVLESIGLDANALTTLFGACKVYGHVELAKGIAEKLFELEPKSSVNYSLMSKVYASVGKWEDAAMTREISSGPGLKCKHPGWSWIDQ